MLTLPLRTEAPPDRLLPFSPHPHAHPADMSLGRHANVPLECAQRSADATAPVCDGCARMQTASLQAIQWRAWPGN
jgi:hypothetical protein